MTGLAFSGIVLVLAGGCQSTWFGASDASLHHTFDRAKTSAAETAPVDSTATTDQSATAAADAQTMASVLMEVRQIGETDPAAQKMLLEELEHAKPEIWPLVVQQFRSSRAFHDQLVARKANSDAKNDAKAAPEIEKQKAAESVAGMDSRPSAKVGQLVDPRQVQPESTVEQSIAAATPANMPAPMDRYISAASLASREAPKPFSADGAAQPLNVPPASASATPSATQQAVFATVSQSSASSTALKENSLSWLEHIDRAIDDLGHRVPESPQSTAEIHQIVSLRLMELLAGRTEDALQPIPKIPPEEQDYWSGQMFALATYLDHHTQPDDKRRAAASVTHLDEAVGHLRELGTLSLLNLTFCKQVYDYGTYDPYDEAKFSPGQLVTLYVEVENYHSESTEKGYCTSLGTNYELVDEKGARVAGGDFPVVDDCCRSRRRDFHIQYGLSLPKTLSPGKYQLELVMKDRRSDKIGHASIAFEIGSGKL